MELESHRLDGEIGAFITCSSSGIISHEDQSSLNLFRLKKKALLDHYLLTWKLKSRAKWEEPRDSNTKFFHALASRRRNQNAIWALEDEDGHSVEDEAALEELGQRHFSHIFRDIFLTSLEMINKPVFWPSSKLSCCTLLCSLLRRSVDSLKVFL